MLCDRISCSSQMASGTSDVMVDFCYLNKKNVSTTVAKRCGSVYSDRQSEAGASFYIMPCVTTRPSPQTFDRCKATSYWANKNPYRTPCTVGASRNHSSVEADRSHGALDIELSFEYGVCLWLVDNPRKSGCSLCDSLQISIHFCRRQVGERLLKTQGDVLLADFLSTFDFYWLWDRMIP